MKNVINEAKKRVKERKEDIKKGKVTTALARLNAEAEGRLEIEFQHTRMLANYETFSHAVEIISESKAINRMERVLVE